MASLLERVTRLEAVVTELTFALERRPLEQVQVLDVMNTPSFRDELRELLRELGAPQGTASISQEEDRKRYLRGLAARARAKKQNLSDEARAAAIAEAEACGVSVAPE